ncbi:MAG TPA: hypothetical protein VM261_34245 [Kofleriaceae bacterium]|nr:hypothetical protein [Kofleriaceae bacterium]
MRRLHVLFALLASVSFCACSNDPGTGGGDDGGDDDVPPTPTWKIDVDMSGLDRYAPADATTWTIAGKVTASEGVDRVTIAGADAATMSDGTFTGDTAIMPGLNPIAILATDQASHTRKANRSILSASYLPAGAHNANGAAMILSDAIVAAMGEGLAGEAGDVDVAAEILARDVLSQDSRCTTWPVEASQGTPQVNLELDGADLWLQIRIPNLYVYFEGQCQGLLSTIPIGGEMGGTLDIWTRLTPNPQPGHDCLTAFRHTAPQVNVGGWHFDVWGTSGPLQAWIVSLFSGGKSEEAREQIRSEVGTRANTMLAEKLADISVFDRTSELELLGRPLGMHLCVSSLDRVGTGTSARLIARVAAAATGAGTRVAPGAPQTSGAVPNPAAGELLLDGNLVAQLLFAAWQDGGLTKPGVEEVETDVLALVAPEIGLRYPSGTKAIVNLDGDLPPYVRATPGGTGDLKVEIGDLVLDLVVGEDRLFRVGAVLRLDLELVPMDGKLVPTVVGSEATAHVLDELYDGTDDLLETVIATKVGSTATSLLSGAAIALPQLPGLGTPADVTPDAGGRFVRIRMQ